MNDTKSPRAATTGTWALPLLALAPLAGIARIVTNGTVTTVDGLFMTIIMLALSGILFLNVYLEARTKFILKKAPLAQKKS